MSADTLHVAALVAYDGTDYAGFQVQNNASTIQGSLELALSKITGSLYRLAGSGRTDSGVHARGQVVTVSVPWKHPIENLQRAWNAHLPSSIVVQKIAAAPENFHPRFSAKSRTYRYFIEWEQREEYNSLPSYSPLSDRYALFVPKSLDVQAMQDAAKLLIGTQDFATFGHPPHGVNTVRTIRKAEFQCVNTDLHPLQNSQRNRCVFTIVANAFLRQMVRNLTGSLLEVGRRHWSLEKFHCAIETRDRRLSAPPAPPNGLFLEYVEYPDYPNLFS
ncbi:MAG: tRNA pseudouridine(38-40) synthase TruA [Chloroflexota bacterium]